MKVKLVNIIKTVNVYLYERKWYVYTIEIYHLS